MNRFITPGRSVPATRAKLAGKASVAGCIAGLLPSVRRGSGRQRVHP
jgi:hypothetical protein